MQSIFESQNLDLSLSELRRDELGCFFQESDLVSSGVLVLALRTETVVAVLAEISLLGFVLTALGFVHVVHYHSEELGVVEVDLGLGGRSMGWGC